MIYSQGKKRHALCVFASVSDFLSTAGLTYKRLHRQLGLAETSLWRGTNAVHNVCIKIAGHFFKEEHSITAGYHLAHTTLPQAGKPLC